MSKLEIFEKETLKTFVETNTCYVLCGRNPIRGQRIFRFCKTLPEKEDVVKTTSVTKVSVLKSNDSEVMNLIDGDYDRLVLVKHILKLTENDGKDPRYFVCFGEKFENKVFRSFRDEPQEKPVYQLEFNSFLDRSAMVIAPKTEKDNMTDCILDKLLESQQN